MNFESDGSDFLMAKFLTHSVGAAELYLFRAKLGDRCEKMCAADDFTGSAFRVDSCWRLGVSIFGDLPPNHKIMGT